MVVTDGIDGIIAENEYGKYSLVYNDTDTNRANKLEVFGKKTAEGLRIAVRVTSKTVVYYNGKPSGIHDVIDHVMLSYRNANGSMVNLFLHADGRMSGYTDKGKVVAFISRIDKSAAGNTTIATKNNAAAFVAEAGHHLVTTYESTCVSVIVLIRQAMQTLSHTPERILRAARRGNLRTAQVLHGRMIGQTR